MRNFVICLVGIIVYCLPSSFIAGNAAFGVEPVPDTDPLPSWNVGSERQAILDFVEKVTRAGGPDYVEPAERIAVFDNDGTLWPEQPMYTQLLFALDRLKAMAPQHPEWKEKEPFKSILAGDKAAMGKMSIQDIEKVVAVTHSGMDVDTFMGEVKDWLSTAKSKHFNCSYTDLAYQPMLEVLEYLRANGFRTYIVTGGGQEFVRTFAEDVYGVPPEQVVGTATKVKYEYGPNGKPRLVKQPVVLIVDDKAGKPETIQLIIGRRPIAAFGNSDGDRQMLEWVQAGDGTRLMMLVHHDDSEREFAYGAESKIGTFSDKLAQEAKSRGWYVISMKDDWGTVFDPKRVSVPLSSGEPEKK